MIKQHEKTYGLGEYVRYLDCAHGFLGNGFITISSTLNICSLLYQLYLNEGCKTFRFH